MTVSLQGKWALITGASSGLGIDFAHLLGQRGCNLILVARRMPQLEKVCKDISAQYGVQAIPIPCDLSIPNAPNELHKTILEKNLQVDVLINNAGFGNFGNFVGIPWEKEQQLIMVNVMAMTQLTKLFLKEMVHRNEGYILLVASLASAAPSPTLATYAASKSYIRSLGEALNFELRKTKVKLTVACPGYTATDFFRANEMKTQPLLFKLTLMKSRTVARSSINAMIRGQPFVVTGLLNKMSDLLVRFVPRRIAVVMAYLFLLQEKPHQGGLPVLAPEQED